MLRPATNVATFRVLGFKIPLFNVCKYLRHGSVVMPTSPFQV